MRASATRAVAGTSSRLTESGGCSALAGGACGLGGTYGWLPWPSRGWKRRRASATQGSEIRLPRSTGARTLMSLPPSQRF